MVIQAEFHTNKRQTSKFFNSADAPVVDEWIPAGP